MVHVENGTDMMSNADRNEIPVMMPGSAIGRMNRREIESLPKNFARERAAAASVPRTSAINVASVATFTDSHNGPQMSGRSNQTTENQRKVKPGGGNWKLFSSVVKA